MRSNLKTKIKILAIEEEIARLELQIQKENQVYITAKTPDQKTKDITIFEQKVLIPIINGILTEYTDCKYFPSDQSIKNSLGFGGSTVTSIMKTVGMASADTTSIWNIEFNNHILHLIITHQGDDLRSSVVNSNHLSQTKHEALQWEVMWAGIPAANATYKAERNKIKGQIERACEGTTIPEPIESSTVQPNPSAQLHPPQLRPSDPTHSTQPRPNDPTHPTQPPPPLTRWPKIVPRH